MDVKIQRYLRGSKHFRNPKLPLTVSLQGYRSSVDKWHRHEDFYELVIVCSGSARNENRAVQEQLHAGNVFLMPDQTVHRYTEIKNFRHYNVLFDPALLDTGHPDMSLQTLPGFQNLFEFRFSGEERCSKINSVDEQNQTKLISMLETIRNETELWLPGWKENAYFEFMRMLVLLLRSCLPQDSHMGQNAFQISRAIQMMEKDCTKQYTLRQLADSVHMSQSCFRHHFTRITGLPPGEYLMNLRLRKAILLLTIANPVAETARLAGFEDSNYFARLIRKRTGFSPKEIQLKFLSGELTVETLLEKLHPVG